MPSFMLLSIFACQIPLFERLTPRRRKRLTGRDLASNALKIVPGLEYLNAPAVWTGLRPGSPDSMPLIGYSKRLDNVVVATGHYHEGFSMSAITGELVAEMMTKATPDKPYLKMYDPDRFNC